MKNAELLKLKLVIAGLLIVKGLVFVFFIPPWQGPDEPTHFEYLAIFAKQEKFQLTLSSDLEIQAKILDSMEKFNFWELVEKPAPAKGANRFDRTYLAELTASQLDTKPPLFYIVSALPLKIFSISSILNQLYIARIISLLFSFATLFLIYKIAHFVFLKDEYLPIAALSFAGFLPQFSYISSVVTPENLAILLVTTVVYCVLGIARNGYSLFRIISVVFFILLCFLTKRTTFISVPFFLAVIILLEGKSLANKGILFVSSVFLLFTGLIVFCTVVGYYDYEVIWRIVGRITNVSQGMGNTLAGLSNATFMITARFFAVLFVSFWFSYGWMVFKMSFFWYVFLGGLTAISVVGVLSGMFGYFREERLASDISMRGITILTILFLFAIMAAFFTHFTPSTQQVTQGRYIYNALSAIAVLFTFGIWKICPIKYKEIGVKYFILFMVFLNGVSIFKYLIPLFYLNA